MSDTEPEVDLEFKHMTRKSKQYIRDPFGDELQREYDLCRQQEEEAAKRQKNFAKAKKRRKALQAKTK